MITSSTRRIIWLQVVALSLLAGQPSRADLNVQGRVWLDENLDGLPAPQESVIADLSLWANRQFLVRSEADGHYSLSLPEGSSYRICALQGTRGVQTRPVALEASYRYGGTTQWAAENGQQSVDITALAADAEGGLYATGRFTGAVDFDPGPGEDIQSDQAGRAFVTYLPPGGGYGWTTVLAGWLEGPTELAVAADRSVLAAGRTRRSRGAAVRLSPDGATLWSFELTGAEIGGLCISDANVYLTGSFQGTVDFDPDPAIEDNRSAEGQADLFLTCLDLAGRPLWIRTAGRIDALAVPQALRADTEGRLYLGGYFRQKMDFAPDPDEDIRQSHGDEDSFLCRYDPNGLYRWTVQFQGSYRNKLLDLAVDLDQSVTVVGHFNHNTTFGQPGPYIQSYDGTAKAYVVRLGPDGEVLWARSLESDLAGRDLAGFNTAATAVAIDPFGFIQVIGERVVDQDGSGYEHFNQQATNDLWLWRLDPAGETLQVDWIDQLATTPPTGYYYDPSAWSVVVDALGDVHVAGRLSFGADLALGPERKIFGPVGARDGFLTTLERLHGAYLVSPDNPVTQDLDFGFAIAPEGLPSHEGQTVPDGNETPPPIDVIPL